MSWQNPPSMRWIGWCMGIKNEAVFRLIWVKKEKRNYNVWNMLSKQMDQQLDFAAGVV